MKKVDLHIHTHYSCDSKTTMQQYCQQAIKTGVSILCFTDHVDYNPADIGYGYYKPNEFFEEFNYSKAKYKGQVELTSGIEFAEPHLYRDELEELKKLPYDFILGSMHFWYKDMFAGTMVSNGIPAETCFEYYFKELLKSVEAGGYDSLAHFDFPIRYYKKAMYPSGIIDDILSTMIKNDIALEINTSSLRNGLTDTMPNTSIIKRFHKLGGRYITFGADSHTITDLAADYDMANTIVEALSLIPVYFKKRERIQIL